MDNSLTFAATDAHDERNNTRERDENYINISAMPKKKIKTPGIAVYPHEQQQQQSNDGDNINRNDATAVGDLTVTTTNVSSSESSTPKTNSSCESLAASITTTSNPCTAENTSRMNTNSNTRKIENNPISSNSETHSPQQSSKVQSKDINQPLNPQNKKTRENSALPPQIPFTFPIGDAVDKNVVKTVNDLIYLLSTYGPLTYHQLEYNLPQQMKMQPRVSHSHQIPQQRTFNGSSNKNDNPKTSRNPVTGNTNNRNTPPVLKQILSVLLCVGIISMVADENDSIQEEKREMAKTAGGLVINNMVPRDNVIKTTYTDVLPTRKLPPPSSTIPPSEDDEIRYVYLWGQPRVDNIFGSTMSSNKNNNHFRLVTMLEKADNEIKDTSDRIKMLRAELLQTDSMGSTLSSKKCRLRTKEFVKEIIEKHPIVSSDPVYIAALKNLNKG